MIENNLNITIRLFLKYFFIIFLKNTKHEFSYTTAVMQSIDIALQ